jgi:hypothetical protein
MTVGIDRIHRNLLKNDPNGAYLRAQLLSIMNFSFTIR